MSKDPVNKLLDDFKRLKKLLKKVGKETDRLSKIKELDDEDRQYTKDLIKVLEDLKLTFDYISNDLEKGDVG